MLSYAVIIPATGVLAYLYIQWHDKLFTTEKYRLFLFAIAGVLLYTQYLIALIGVALACFLLWDMYRTTGSFYRTTLYLWKSFALFGTMVSILIVYVAMKGYQTTTWDAGDTNNFVFSPQLSLGEMFQFFPVNIYLLVTRLIGFIIEQSAFNWVIFPIIFIMTGIGVLSSFLYNRQTDRSFLGWLLCIALIWFVFIIAGRLSLSPSHKLLVFLPFIVYMILRGLNWLCHLATQHRTAIMPRMQFIVCGGLMIVISGIYFVHYSAYITPRQDNYNEKEIQQLFTRYDVDKVFIIKGVPLSLMHFSATQKVYMPPHLIHDNKSIDQELDSLAQGTIAISHYPLNDAVIPTAVHLIHLLRQRGW